MNKSIKAKESALARLNALFDKNTANINSPSNADGLLWGEGKVNGKTVFAISRDNSYKGGSLNMLQAEIICDVIYRAEECGAPFLFIMESAGARVQDGIDGLEGYGRIFSAVSFASGKIPLIFIAMGVCAGGAAYTAALCDAVIMNAQNGRMFVTGPKVLKNATGETATDKELCSAEVHSYHSGDVHFCENGEEECILKARQLLSYLPQNCGEMPKRSAEYTAGNISFDVPKDFKKPYDMLSVINAVTDKDSFLPIQQDFAANIITGFGRIKGMCIGIVANQPNVLCGALDVDSSCKAARFISFCDSFNIPIITLTDTPGFLPGKSQEQKGILRHGAKLLAAYSGATVPKITVIIRKAVGGAYIAMNSNGIGADKVFAWENAKISVMDDQLSASFSKDEKTRSGGLERALETGAVSCVIKPCQTVEAIAESLKLLLKKYTPQSSKKRFNIPQ